MANKDGSKRLGKKHRSATTRPKKGRAPKSTPTTGAVDPRKRKVLSTKKAEANKLARTPKRSPDNEARKTIAPPAGPGRKTTAKKTAAKKASTRPADGIVGRQTPSSMNMGDRDDWRDVEFLAAQLSVETERPEARDLPLIAVCGRPNVGKSTLFNRLTGSRRSIVGDEPGITRDRIYGEVEWFGRDARIVDTGGVIPDDEALIPSEIFRQAQVALEEADSIIMVVDGRTELASPDLELARLLLRGGKPVFLAVNKMDTDALLPQAENFRRLGFRNVFPISAEHNGGIGDLMDEVFESLPEPKTHEEEADPDFEETPTEVMMTEEDEEEEDSDGAWIAPPPLTEDQVRDRIEAEQQAAREAYVEPEAPVEVKRPRLLRSHGEHELKETKVAIIGRPNVGKSTLLNALTGTDRAIVSPIAGTTRDAVDEVVERGGHSFRFVDTAGIRRKGKTKLMAEKLSVIMARKHLEAADVSLLIIDATEGVAALDANIGGYAHESGRSVIIVVNKWDLMTKVGKDGMRLWDGKPPVDPKIYEQDVRDALKYLDYAPLLFISALDGKGVDQVFKKVELVSRERRKRVTTGQMNKFLEKVDFQKASVPMNRRVRIYYMTQAAVAPPTFILFTDKDVKMHFSFERFLANQIRDHFGFIGSPIWFKIKARNKKKEKD
ncbi:ribosome biogenesis GTPase Der [Granulicella sibirica]|uniref:GTPase Der n=1 Tax=Granulicella sibirica TaxID=2479048 RepID=A0A4Q0T2X5_9BACT|nr:ribosome biogenesis GTPase Der [Granulicella sibirica]RXH56800.1 GTP-binding protein EngA [Granulicella sibirica]